MHIDKHPRRDRVEETAPRHDDTTAPPKGHRQMLALLSSPLRRWLLVTLLLPVIAFALSKLGLYLQRRNGGAPTRVSRALLSISTFTRRLSSGRREIPEPEATPSSPAAAQPTPSVRA